ncbi:ATP-binding cassette sub-family A member 2-like [Physella acuta]|uniref:ATP-binding cassette sub-family A member 2-like n=1 Tax=Physella acuta TaxID=109671 RepID=UPI0027DC9C2E|nr:ATP-binding cassette sub-family A member 2-like [Physella acuta]
MILNTAFNVFFVWYISNIFPGEFGIPKPFNFMFTRSYWVPTAVEEKELPDIPPEEEKYFETPNSDWKAGIQVRNLIKMFGKNVAVAGTNMDVYEGQITVLLGHNGAGKTTTINMITGFMPPTSGTITVHGLDMRKNTDAARKSIGFCPQHDILFAKLTCKEHLIFFLKIKGKYKKELMPGIIERLNSVGLGGKINDYSSQLSGGQKRKLSLACAFSGDTQVVFLDEPSTGLDPAARQEMWAFLKTMREGRTILLTTHYMDEADVLGDRIAIMAEGRVKCCGTPMFLKRVYGAGYRLKIVKQPGCNTDAVTQQINQILPQAKFMSETNSEIDYLLPEIVTEKFPQLLKILEDDTERLQINGFGLTATSMEDVFVKVGEGVTAEDIAAAVEEEVPLAANEVHNVEKTSKMDSGTIVIDMAASDPSGFAESAKTDNNVERSSNVDLSQNNTKPLDESVVSQSQQQTDKIFKMFHVCKSGSKLGVFGQQLRGIVIKKWVLFRRNLISSLVLIALPSIILGMGIYSDKSKTETSMEPMVFSAEHLTNVITPIESNEQTNQELVKEFKKQLPSSEFPVHDTLDPNEYFLRWLKANGKEKYDKMVLGVVFEQHDFVHLYFNGRIRHAPGIAVQLMLNAEVKRVLGEEFSVQSGLRYFSSDLANEESLKTFMALNFAMALVPVVFIYSLIVERATGAKHLQTLSGVHPIAYWLGTFVIDFLVMLLLIVLTLCLLTLNPKTFIDNDRWLVLLIGFLCFGCTTFPFLYLVQNIFSSPSRGIVVLLIANVVIGVVIGLIIGMLKMMGVTLTGMYFYLDLAFGYISPSYSLSVILTTVLGVNSKIAKNFTEMMDYNNQILPEVFYKFLGQAAVSWILILFIEYKLHRFIWYNIPCLGSLICKGKSQETVAKEDDDVSNERKRVHGSKKEDLVNKDALLLIDLKKVYCGLFGSTKTAVHPVSFGVPDKECLGLLGQNGAGKTTIFKMLTGDITLSAGEAYVGGYNIKSHLKKVQSMMSYCPQFDALHDVLTGRETLYLYGRLRGVREHCLHEITEIIIDFITLRPHEDKITSAYSGGNKRKLSIGIAIIGDPHFIMLDEPTAGMDPISRRSLWKCLHMIRSMERTLVLTSHSMEECEALCTKIAILKRGRLMCLGSTQHLKNKFAQGYTVILHAKHQEDGSILPLKPSVDFLISSIPGTTVFNAQPSYYHLQVPETARLSEIFRLSLEARSTFDLQHFTVQQTSLEQVFLLLMKDEK